MPNLRRIILCADDFALDSGTSSAILELSGTGRISAVSCLSDSPHWPRAGRELAACHDRVLIGLHFNLTATLDEVRMPLKKTIVAAIARRLDDKIVRSQLVRQIDRFTAVVGKLPDFIDGHEHIHVFPIVADVVRRVAAEISPCFPVPIRSVSPTFGPTDTPVKRAVIRALASMGGTHTPGVQSRQLNSGFAGIYSLSARADFARLFRAWLETAPDRGLIMCHPRLDTTSGSAAAGMMEFLHLSSADVASLLDSRHLRFLRRSELSERNDTNPSSEGMDGIVLKTVPEGECRADKS